MCYVSLLYRLLSRIGFKGPEDYEEFLNFAEQESNNSVVLLWFTIFFRLIAISWFYQVSASTEAKVTVSSLRLDIGAFVCLDEY